ncbi:MAG: aminopeptidase [Candidatus Hadarchaeales archaeon]
MAEPSLKELKKIARAFVRNSMKIGKRGDRYEAVRITCNYTDPTCERFARMVEEECWRVGAHTLFLSYSSARQRLSYQLRPDDSLKEMSPLAEAIAKNVDVSIFIGEEEDPNWAAGLAEKVKLTAPIREKLHEILDKRKVRWAYFGWPVPEAGRFYGCRPSRFREIFFESIRQTFSGRVQSLCRAYERALKGRREVRIVADDGTDLTFSIQERPVLVDDGEISEDDLKRGDVGLNVPAGEVFVAPLETSANGKIIFDNVAIPGFGKVRGLELRFKNGKVVEHRAAAGGENFARFLKANTGEKDRIAEFGIGTNPGAEYTGGSIIIDEKIFGTIHIAIGNNRGAYHGKNKASSHLDMIKDMRDGKVLVDGKVVMERGHPITGD